MSDYDRTKAKIYEEKCSIQMLILLTKTHREKLNELSKEQEKTAAQIIRDLLDKEFEKYGI